MNSNKIVLFIASLSSGGAEHQITFLANLLSDKGYDVELVTYSDGVDFYRINESVKRTRIAPNMSIWKKLFSIFAFFLRTNAKKVISFGSRDNFIALLPLLLRPSVQCVVSERCVLWGKLRWFQKLNYGFLYKRSSVIVTNSYAQCNDIGISYPKYKNKLVTITNYTDTNMYKIQSPPENELVEIGIFCRYVPQKNYVLFAEAVMMLKERVGKIFHITWYGNKKIAQKPNAYYEHFEELVKKNNINDVITLNDHTTNVADLIPTFDALCLPSLTEGFSNSISEYICCGKPVLCSDVADNSLMVEDGKNGYLFDPRNVENIVSAFERFFNTTREQRLQMGKYSRIKAEQLFDKEKFVNSYISLFHDELTR